MIIIKRSMTLSVEMREISPVLHSWTESDMREWIIEADARLEA